MASDLDTSTQSELHADAAPESITGGHGHHAGVGGLFSNMKVGMKVGLATGVILAFLVTVAAITFFGLQGANTHFSEYRGLAEKTMTAGTTEAHILSARVNMKDSLLKNSDEATAKVHEAIVSVIEEIDKNIELYDDPQQKAEAEKVSKELQAYRKSFEEVTALVHERNVQVDELNRIGPLAEKDLSEIMRGTFEDGDASASYLAGVALRHLLLGRLYSNRFLVDNQTASEERALKELSAFDETAVRIRDGLRNPERRQLAVQVVEIAQEYTTVFEKVAGIINQRSAIVTGTLDVIGPRVALEMDDIRVKNGEAQNELGPRATASIDKSVNTSVTVAAIALVLGILLAFLLGRGISRPVIAMAGAMGTLAKGDLTVEIPALGRRDEVGQMAAAVQVFKENAQEME
ncbi:MAG: HAMP domain-containing protein, partial [Kiloniellaceae bacterium]